MLILNGLCPLGGSARTARCEEHSGRGKGLKAEEHAHPGRDEDEDANREWKIAHREQAHEPETEEKQQDTEKQPEATAVRGDIRARQVGHSVGASSRMASCCS